MRHAIKKRSTQQGKTNIIGNKTKSFQHCDLHVNYKNKSQIIAFTTTLILGLHCSHTYINYPSTIILFARADLMEQAM